MYTYLIVDDEMIERKGIRMLLSWMNIRENILEASNGEEALEVFEKEKIDVLLTDINMPFMDGIELLSRIHEEYPGTEIVIFSGYDEFSYAKKAISYGVSAYILKPVNPEEFKKVVGEITEKLAKSEREEKRKDESMEFLREHLLYLMVNGQSRSAMQEKTQMLLDMSFVRNFCRMVLLECANNYFEQVNSEQIEKMQSDLQMPFHYLNLNPQQSILFLARSRMAAGKRSDGSCTIIFVKCGTRNAFWPCRARSRRTVSFTMHLHRRSSSWSGAFITRETMFFFLFRRSSPRCWCRLMLKS
ncbi:MAG: response regulator [Fusicatenibacter saccharivorans]